MIKFPFAAAAWAVALAHPAALAAHQTRHTDPADIDRAVARFTAKETGSNGGPRPVDPRLRLAACHVPLALSWHGPGRDTVRVACAQDGGWQIFVAAGSAGPGQGAAGGLVIARGDRVTIRFVGRAFAISTAGRAMETGTVGSFIRVRPEGNRAPLRARVEQAGIVSVMPEPQT